MTASIVHRYIFSQQLRNLILCSLMFTCLFLFVDFFDRIDNVLEGEANLYNIISYFGYKIPLMFSITLPVSMLVATLFTIGNLTRYSEMTALRASGLRLWWLSIPIFIIGFLTSILTFIIGETLVPYAQRRANEVYNIDIRKRDQLGLYNRESFWFREGDDFYSAKLFDSRKNSLLGLSIFSVTDASTVSKRVDAKNATWVGQDLGWSMRKVLERTFSIDEEMTEERFQDLPLPIDQTPDWFYSSGTDPASMSFSELKNFISRQAANGLSTKSYMGDLYSKIAFPFINLILPLLVIPFAVGSGRTKSLATATIAAMLTGFSYHVINSLSIALARAELWPAMPAAWAANLVLGGVGIILFLGAEAPE